MTPKKFCELAMTDYERQWAIAAGHQERHPLRVKMALLRELCATDADADAFGLLLEEGSESNDPQRALLCAELAPRWRRLRPNMRQS